MIIDPETFCKEVEESYAHNDGICMFDAVFGICDNHGVDYDMVGPLVNRSIREKIKIEAIKKNLLKTDSHTLFEI